MKNLLVDWKSMKLIQIIDPVLQLAPFGASVDGVREEVDICVQRELVHGVYPR